MHKCHSFIYLLLPDNLFHILQLFVLPLPPPLYILSAAFIVAFHLVSDLRYDVLDIKDDACSL